MSNTQTPRAELEGILMGLAIEARALASLLSSQRPDAADEGGVMDGLAVILDRFADQLSRAESLLPETAP